MYDVSGRFLDAISGSHRAVVRVQVLPTSSMPQFGANPTGGTELPLVDGDVKLSSTADVNGSVDFTISGDYWDVLQPYGAELFVERGIDFGDGTRELVPCGYYGIEEITQGRAPSGPVKVSGFDRGKRLQRNRVVYPIEFAAGSTHRAIFQHLVNGHRPAGTPIRNYGMFEPRDVPIVWSGYDPDVAKIGSSLTCEDDAHALLAKIADARGCVLRFARTGELLVQPRSLPPGAEAVYAVRPGPTGNLIAASRKVTRDGVYNIIVARGSDPANPTGYRLAYNNDADSPLFWNGSFGRIVRYYASPLILSFEAADVAAESVLSRYKGLPSALSMMAVPNPALDPLDVVQATIGNAVATHLVDQVGIPLVGSQPVEIVTRTLNEVPTDEDPTSGGGGFPNPDDPGAGGGGTVTLAPPGNHQSVMDVATRVVTTSWTLTPGSDATEVHEFLVDPANTLKATITAPGTTRVSAALAGGRDYQYAVRAVKGTELSGFSNRVRILADGSSVDDGPADPGGGSSGGGSTDLTTAAGRNNWGAPLPQSDEFTAATLDTTKWSAYNGVGHDGNGRRLPSRIAVVNGVLTLTGLENGDSAGMSHKFGQQYGRWEIRARSFLTATGGGGGTSSGAAVGQTQTFADSWTSGVGSWTSVQTHSYEGSASGYNLGGEYRMNIVDGGSGHTTALRTEVRDGDTAVGSHERCELSSFGKSWNDNEGDERWYEFDVKFGDPSWSPGMSSTDDWLIFFQWHQPIDDGSPALAMAVHNDGKVYFEREPDSDFEFIPAWTVRPGQWEHVVVHVKWSTSSSTGFIECHVNDQVVVAKRFCKTMYSADHSDYYVKLGQYRRSSVSGTTVVLHDNLRISGPPATSSTGGTTTPGGVPYHPVAIIWPDDDQWPESGEYDFMENDQPGDDHAEAFIHYPHPASVDVQQEHATRAGVDLSQWHNFGFEWTSAGVKGFLDGVQWFSYAGGAISGTRSNIQAMPSGHLTLQLDNFNGSSGNQPATMEIDWVRVYTLVPQGTGGGGGGTTTGTLADRLRLGAGPGLTKVNLGVDFLAADGPAGKKGQHVDYVLSALTQTSLPAEFAGYCDLRDTGAVRLTAYVGGATTPNSTHSRTEFRELAANGVDKASWSSTSGEHYVWVRGSVVRKTPGRPHVVLAQIHDSADDVATIRMEGTTVVSTYGDTGRPGTLATGVQDGSIHQWMIKSVRIGSTTQIQYFWDDMVNPKATQNYAGGSGNYFKAGNYQQSSSSTDAVGEMAVVDLYDLEVWHTGYPEPTSRH